MEGKIHNFLINIFSYNYLQSGQNLICIYISFKNCAKASIQYRNYFLSISCKIKLLRHHKWHTEDFFQGRWNNSDLDLYIWLHWMAFMCIYHACMYYMKWAIEPRVLLEIAPSLAIFMGQTRTVVLLELKNINFRT